MRLIESDTWRLWSEPDSGVQWLAAEVCKEGQWHSVVPDCRSVQTDGTLSTVNAAGQSAAAPLAAANFHMLPYSNRIRNGRFDFQGRTVELEHAQKHAIHGALRKLPWQAVSHTASSLRCQLSSQDHPAINWPWPIEASIDQRVEANLLVSTLTLTNRSDSDMPAGFGWHPYFVRVVNGSHATLTLPVSGLYPDESGDCLPDGAAIDIPENLNFNHPRLLDPSQRIDCCLNGLQGTCVIDWRNGGIKLNMSASDICTHLVLFNPDMPHFAVEPVTNANDAFNLSTNGIEAGMQVLKSGETMEATMTLEAIC